MNQQGSAEWIQERLGRFTASEIHKLIPQGKGGQPFSDTGQTANVFLYDGDIQSLFPKFDISEKDGIPFFTLKQS